MFFVWWGIHTLAKPLVNYGMVAFALTVIWFYFASVMNKLDRSLGLIVLGILFLAGGWALEYTRRRIVAHGNGRGSMKAVRPGLIFLFIQLVLVLSVAGKYLYERQTRPSLWNRATQFDPDLPLRGRYLALQLLLDACGLPRDAGHAIPQYQPSRFFLQWKVSLAAVNGKLVPRLDVATTERP